jgi:ankyrin repeat protein
MIPLKKSPKLTFYTIIITSLYSSFGYSMETHEWPFSDTDDLTGVSRDVSPVFQKDINPRDTSPLLYAETSDLILAVEQNDPVEISALLAAGRDVNTRGRFGRTALHEAIQRKNPDIVRLLLDRGADPAIQDNCGYTALHHAVAKDYAGQVRNPTIIRLLLDHGADRTVNVQNFSMHDTPLHKAAAFESNPIIIEMLLAAGANPNIQNGDSETPLHVNLSYGDHGNEQTVHLLLEAHADPNNAGSKGITPLHLAAMNGKIEIFRMLVKAGADIRKPDNDGHTPLHYAMSHEIITELLALGAAIDQQDQQGRTALHHVASSNYIDKALVLIARGADLKLRDHYQQTPVDIAIGGEFSDMIRVIYACFHIQRKKEQALAAVLALATHPRLGTQSPLCLLSAHLLTEITHQAILDEARSNILCDYKFADIIRTIRACLLFQNLKEQAAASTLATAMNVRIGHKSPLYLLSTYLLSETTHLYNESGCNYPLLKDTLPYSSLFSKSLIAPLAVKDLGHDCSISSNISRFITFLDREHDLCSRYQSCIIQ